MAGGAQAWVVVHPSLSQLWRASGVVQEEHEVWEVIGSRHETMVVRGDETMHQILLAISVIASQLPEHPVHVLLSQEGLIRVIGVEYRRRPTLLQHLLPRG